MKCRFSMVLGFLMLFFNYAKGSSNFFSDSLSVTLNYSETNYALFQKIALPEDRLLFFPHQVLNSYGWPPELPQGKVITTWPSWKEAQQYENKWAPYTDIFGYDIEGDSPPDEISDVAQTIRDLLVYLQQVSQRYGHTIRLSTGLNYNFGTWHVDALAQSEAVHIHANQLLRTYPAKDPQDMNYVEWAVTRATEVRAVNPEVGIWFAVLVSGMTANQAIQVAEALISGMKAQDMRFGGFTMWAETDTIKTFLSWLRGVTFVEDREPQTPLRFELEQNFPNPINPTTVISFQLPVRSHATLKVFDVLGIEVATLVEGELNAGEHSVVFDATGLPSGVYFYRLTSLSGSLSKSMELIK